MTKKLAIAALASIVVCSLVLGILNMRKLNEIRTNQIMSGATHRHETDRSNRRHELLHDTFKHAESVDRRLEVLEGYTYGDTVLKLRVVSLPADYRPHVFFILELLPEGNQKALITHQISIPFDSRINTSNYREFLINIPPGHYKSIDINSIAFRDLEQWEGLSDGEREKRDWRPQRTPLKNIVVKSGEVLDFGDIKFNFKRTKK